MIRATSAMGVATCVVVACALGCGEMRSASDGVADADAVGTDAPWDARPVDAGGSNDAATQCTSPTSLTPTVAMFHLNVQEYGRFDEAATIIGRVLDLHESLCVPLDVFLTSPMIARLDTQDPALLERILRSPVTSVSYLVRPPMPYRANFVPSSGHDWYGMWELDAAGRADVVRLFETSQIDLGSGTPLAGTSGGVARLTELYGRPPYAAGILADSLLDAAGNPVTPTLQETVDEVFAELGVTFVTIHSRASYLGDTRNGLAAKPEVVGVRLFNLDSSLDNDACLDLADGADIYDCEIAKCSGGTPERPCTVAFKMHDNNFLTERSWWLTVYARPLPPWNPDQVASAISDADRTAMWQRYEQTVMRAHDRAADTSLVKASDWAARL